MNINEETKYEYDDGNGCYRVSASPSSNQQPVQEYDRESRGREERRRLTQVIDDYQSLLTYFVEELSSCERETENSENDEDKTMLKDDVVFFAQELLWRFDNVKDHWTSYSESIGKSDHEINNDPARENQPNSATRASPAEENALGSKVHGETHVEPRDPKDGVDELQATIVHKEEDIRKLRQSLDSVEQELMFTKKRVDSQQTKLASAQGRLKYLEIAFHTAAAEVSKPTNNRLLQAPFLNAVAAASVAKASCDDFSSFYDSSEAEEMRQEIVQLAKLLETSENQRATLYDERKLEKEDTFRKLGQIKLAVNQLILSIDEKDSFRLPSQREIETLD